MDYLNTYPNACIRYHAGDIVLNIDNDAAYLVIPKARSWVVGCFHCSEHPSKPKQPKLKGAIMVECKTLDHAVSSTAEAEVAGVYHNASMAIPIKDFL